MANPSVEPEPEAGRDPLMRDPAPAPDRPPQHPTSDAELLEQHITEAQVKRQLGAQDNPPLSPPASQEDTPSPHTG